jgi:stress-induced morphogen
MQQKNTVRPTDDGLQHIARHRLVYGVEFHWMPERLHALNITVITLKESGL